VQTLEDYFDSLTLNFQRQFKLQLTQITDLLSLSTKTRDILINKYKKFLQILMASRKLKIFMTGYYVKILLLKLFFGKIHTYNNGALNQLDKSPRRSFIILKNTEFTGFHLFFNCKLESGGFTLYIF